MNERAKRDNLKKMRGRPFDEFRCFYIKDFAKGDSIRVSLSRHGPDMERGVVTEIDLNNCLIHYKTSSEDEKVTTIDRIVTLEGFIKTFLNS